MGTGVAQSVQRVGYGLTTGFDSRQ